MSVVLFRAGFQLMREPSLAAAWKQSAVGLASNAGTAETWRGLGMLGL